MEKLENILKKLPKKRLPKKADWLIRFRLTKIMIGTRFFALKNTPLFKPVFNLAIIVFLILIISFPVFSYADQNIVKGDTLYPVKRAVEKLEYLTAIDDVSKAEKDVKFSERRIEEAKKIGEDTKITETKKQEKIDTVKDAIKNIESADNIINAAPENNTQTVIIKEKIIELKKNNLFGEHKFVNPPIRWPKEKNKTATTTDVKIENKLESRPKRNQSDDQKENKYQDEKDKNIFATTSEKIRKGQNADNIKEEKNIESDKKERKNKTNNATTTRQSLPAYSPEKRSDHR